MGIFGRRNNYDDTTDYSHGHGMTTGHGQNNYGPNSGNNMGMTDRNNYPNSDGRGITGNDRLGHQNDYSNTHGGGVTGNHGLGRDHDNYPSNTGGTGGIMNNQGRHHNDYSNTAGGGGMLHDQNRNHNDYPNRTGSGGLMNNQGRNDYSNNTGGTGGMMNHGRNHNDYRDGGPQTNGGHYQQKPKRSFFGGRGRDHTNTRGGGLRKSNDSNRHNRSKRPLFDMESGEFNRRPSFGQWIKMTWLDILTMAIMGAIGLGVYEAHPAPSRSFPVTFSDGEIVFPQFAYPLRHEIIPIWEAAILGSLVPIAVILLMQIRIRSFWDTNNAIIGLLYSLIAAAVFQVFIKWLIGGLRPHFLTVCDPDPSLLTSGGTGYGNIMFQRNICRGNTDDIDDSLESMPSGHSTAAWAGFLYLYYYLNAKLKVFANYHPAFWKLIVTYAPLLGAFLITGALTIDEYHNWYDCLAGAIIGSVMATSAYRMVYASVWDFRFNHIPLTRHTPFSYGAGQAGAGGFETAVFTHAGGWGYEEAFGGAPFDAAHGLRGQVNGFNTGIHQNHGLHHEKKGDIEHNAGLKHGEKGLGHSTSRVNQRHGDTGLGHDTTGVHHRQGDRDLNHNNTTGIGHNATGVGHNTTGIGHNTAGVGHNTTGVGHNTTGIGHNTTGIGHNTGSTHNINRDRGYDSGVPGTNTGTGAGATSGINRPRTPGDQADGRYHQTSRSVERKALPREPDNVRAVSGDYNRRSNSAHYD